MKKYIKMLVALMALGSGHGGAQAQTQTVAHRGYWRTEGSAQNSRTSLQKALDLGVFGSEIDVWLTTDGHLMVNHDARFKGVVVQDADAATCRAIVLDNGEQMPELEELLDIMRRNRKSRTRLVVEVKPHREAERSRECARRTVQAIRRKHLRKRVLYISFSIEACQTLHELEPKAEVAYLSGDRTPAELHAMGLTGLDYHIDVLRKHPEWVGEAHALGMNVNVWTVDDEAAMREMQALGVDFITTNEPVRCASILGTHTNTHEYFHTNTHELRVTNTHK